MFICSIRVRKDTERKAKFIFTNYMYTATRRGRDHKLQRWVSYVYVPAWLNLGRCAYGTNADFDQSCLNASSIIDTWQWLVLRSHEYRPRYTSLFKSIKAPRGGHMSRIEFEPGEEQTFIKRLAMCMDTAQIRLSRLPGTFRYESSPHRSQRLRPLMLRATSVECDHPTENTQNNNVNPSLYLNTMEGQIYGDLR